jgi:RNA polymerase sigma factor (sigma-70 family)
MKDGNLDVTGQLGPLRRYALSLTRNPTDAEDLVHDTLVKAIERQGQFRLGRNLRTWLLSILHNAFVDGQRARRAETLRTAEFGRTAETAVPAGQEHSAAGRPARGAAPRLDRRPLLRGGRGRTRRPRRHRGLAHFARPCPPTGDRGRHRERRQHHPPARSWRCR